MTTKSSFVFGTRPSHVHQVGDVKIECNSPYCELLDAHPLDQERQQPPWATVPR